MLRYKTETRPGLVALYDIRPGNGAVHSYNPGAHTGLFNVEKCCDLEIGVKGHSRSLRVVTFDRLCMVSY